jgi:hypothetical protein
MVENDPQHQFGTANYRAAKGLFDHLVGIGDGAKRPRPSVLAFLRE